MQTVQLLRIDSALAAALNVDAQHFETKFAVRVGDMARLVHEVMGASLHLAAADPPWGAYLVADRTSRYTVGTCAFKSPPTAEGIVEIAYFTFPPFENQGYATTMAFHLIELAQSDPAVARVIAHTLPQPNASTRVLQKVGMRFVGEVWDPEDGQVWRWEKEREA
jgi:RimJ/RimL family protein N-acetyltransferase